MHITDWLEMLGEHFPLVVIGCAEALLAVVLLCAALRNRRQCADKNGAHSGGQKDVSVWKKYCAWDGAQPFETVLRTKNGEWVQTQGLNSLTQPAAYYRLTGDAPEANTVEISVQNASRDAVYAPASMEKVTDGDRGFGYAAVGAHGRGELGQQPADRGADSLCGSRVGLSQLCV